QERLQAPADGAVAATVGDIEAAVPIGLVAAPGESRYIPAKAPLTPNLALALARVLKLSLPEVGGSVDNSRG
ncbi:MAG: hypothetical protein ABII81_01155, partial [Pseudomonadota bacterium]